MGTGHVAILSFLDKRWRGSGMNGELRRKGMSMERKLKKKKPFALPFHYFLFFGIG